MRTNYHTFFTNLANPLKMDIVLLLRKREMSVGDICKALKCEQSKLSHALISLKRCKVVKFEQKGKQRLYSLNKNTILPMLNLIDKHAHAHCGRPRCVCKD